MEIDRASLPAEGRLGEIKDSYNRRMFFFFVEIRRSAFDIFNLVFRTSYFVLGTLKNSFLSQLFTYLLFRSIRGHGRCVDEGGG